MTSKGEFTSIAIAYIVVQAIRSCMPSYGPPNGVQGGRKPAAFHLVQGPPGTGKTQLICGIVSCWLHSNVACEDRSDADGFQRKKPRSDDLTRVLVCAQSNAGMHACCFIWHFELKISALCLLACLLCACGADFYSSDSRVLSVSMVCR
jgi:hypothetical protein